MAELKEVFEMVTKQTEPDLDSWKQQEDRQRRSVRNRKLGAVALVAAIIVGLSVFALVRAPNNDAPPLSSNSPSASVQTLSIVDVNTRESTPFTAPISTSGFDITLDGSMVTYTDFDESGRDQVFVMDADGSDKRQLTHTPGGVTPMGSPPQWSPDGSRIAYWAVVPEGNVQLFVVRLSDAASTRVTDEPSDVYEGGWVSDGSFVFSTSNAQSQYPLVAKSIDVETKETTTIARDLSTPEVSPDGTQIAFDAYFHPEGQAWLSLIDIDGTGRTKIQQVSYSSGSLPKWSPDSAQIAYLDDTDGRSGTYVYDLTSGESRFVTAGTVESWVDDDHILVS